LRSGTRALRACCLTIPAIVSTLAYDTATASTAASPAPPHFKKLLLTRRRESPTRSATRQ
jgi:hypothetical protein